MLVNSAVQPLARYTWCGRNQSSWSTSTTAPVLFTMQIGLPASDPITRYLRRCLTSAGPDRAHGIECRAFQSFDVEAALINRSKHGIR